MYFPVQFLARPHLKTCIDPHGTYHSLISLGAVLLITPHSNLVVFHLDWQIRWIKKELEKKKKRKPDSVDPCIGSIKFPGGIIIKKVHQCSLCSSHYTEVGSPVIVLENSFRKLDQFDLALHQENGPMLPGSFPWINFPSAFYEMEGNEHVV